MFTLTSHVVVSSSATLKIQRPDCLGQLLRQKLSSTSQNITNVCLKCHLGLKDRASTLKKLNRTWSTYGWSSQGETNNKLFFQSYLQARQLPTGQCVLRTCLVISHPRGMAWQFLQATLTLILLVALTLSLRIVAIPQTCLKIVMKLTRVTKTSRTLIDYKHTHMKDMSRSLDSLIVYFVSPAVHKYYFRIPKL